MSGDRAVSEVISALIIAAIIIIGTAVYVGVAGQRISLEASSLANMVWKAQRRQGEMLSLTYSHPSGDQLKLYIYNYGKVHVKPIRLYINGIQKSFTLIDAVSGESIGEIAPEQLALLSVRKYGNSPYEIIIVTETGSTFTWKIA